MYSTICSVFLLPRMTRCVVLFNSGQNSADLAQDSFTLKELAVFFEQFENQTPSKITHYTVSHNYIKYSDILD